jgi:hemerythrin-like domain-containing protein
MKRHEALIPLSREHHDGLILARLLQKDAPAYKGLPTDDEGKPAYAIEVFNKILKQHFATEEVILAAIKNTHPEIDRLFEEITIEHKQLTTAFRNLHQSSNLHDALDMLGINLEQHIRKEERVLFPLIQEHCDEASMQKFKEHL